MAQGMPHLPREGNPIAFEDESTERVRLGIDDALAKDVGAGGWATWKTIAAIALLVVVAAAVVFLVLLRR